MAFHKLNVSPTSQPIRKKVWHFHWIDKKIIQMEIDKLLEVGFTCSGLVGERGGSLEERWEVTSLC